MKRRPEPLESVKIELLPGPDDETDDSSPRGDESSGTRATKWLAIGAGVTAVALIIAFNQAAPQEIGRAVPLPDTMVSSSQNTPSGPSQSGPTTSGPTPSAPTTSSPSAGTGTPTDSANPNLPAAESAEDLDACGNPLSYTDFSAVPMKRLTGIKALVGAGSVVDLDTGKITEPFVQIGAKDRIAQSLHHNDITYLLIEDCEGRIDADRVIALNPDGSSATLKVPLTEDEFLGTMLELNNDIYFRVYTLDGRLPIVLKPVTGGATLELPPNFNPVATDDKWVIGENYSDDGARLKVELFNSLTEELRVLEDIEINTGGGPTVIAYGAGSIVWGEASSSGENGQLHVYKLLTGAESTGPWRAPNNFQGWQVSPDGRYVLGRLLQQMKMVEDRGVWPASYGVIDLRTGEFEPVPDLLDPNVFSSQSVTVGFAASGSTLLISAPAADGVHLLTWRPGDPNLSESSRVVDGTPITLAAVTELADE